MNTYLIAYDADNDFWLCEADDVDHAVEQFVDASLGADINHIWVCYPVEHPSVAASQARP